MQKEKDKEDRVVIYISTIVGLHRTKLIFLVITSVIDVLHTHSRFEAKGRTPYIFYKSTMSQKYVSNGLYNK